MLSSCQQLAEYLENNADAILADVAYTLHVARPEFSCRASRVCDDRRQAIEALRQFTADDFETVATDSPVVAFMFPGQGAQHVQMGRDLYEHESVFRGHVDAAAEVLEPLLNLDIRELLYPREQTDCSTRLTATEIAQPAMYVIEYAQAKLWESWGIRPTCMIGHSVGEFVAATLAGVLRFEDALRLLVARGRLMQAQPPGCMLAVMLPEERVSHYCGQDVHVAAVNAPESCVVSGPSADIAALQRRLADENITSRRLETSHAFHSPMMQPAVEPFVEEVRRVVPATA